MTTASIKAVTHKRSWAAPRPPAQASRRRQSRPARATARCRRATPPASARHATTGGSIHRPGLLPVHRRWTRCFRGACSPRRTLPSPRPGLRPANCSAGHIDMPLSYQHPCHCHRVCCACHPRPQGIPRICRLTGCIRYSFCLSRAKKKPGHVARRAVGTGCGPAEDDANEKRQPRLTRRGSASCRCARPAVRPCDRVRP